MFGASLRKIGLKLWQLECLEDFEKKLLSDLLFYPTSPMFVLDPDMIKTNILSKFEENWVKIVVATILTQVRLECYLSIYVPMYLCIYLCTYVPMYLCTYVPMYLSTYLPTYLPIFLSIYLSINLSIYLSIYLCSTT